MRTHLVRPRPVGSQLGAAFSQSPQSWKVRIPVCPSPVQCRAHQIREEITDGETLLDSYWKARGVFDEQQRRGLVSAGLEYEEAVASSSQHIWSQGSEEEIVAVSKRLLQLQLLLGGFAQPSTNGKPKSSDRRLHRLSQSKAEAEAEEEENKGADIVWMVTREPRLLTADYFELTRRLLDMKVLTAGTDLDVLALITRQPGLLLTDSWQGASAEGDSLSQLLSAWEHGLGSDDAEEWQRRYDQLVQYKLQHGDAHCGFRDGDDSDLSKWANKQRSDFKEGKVEQQRLDLLSDIGFEFSRDEAEWRRWFSELHKFSELNGHCSPQPLATGVDMYLINWASIQRIALRSRVLSDSRKEALDSINFDWTGADPLS